MPEFWLSTNRMTIWVKSENGIIVDAAPIARRFIGQPGKNLQAWLRKQGGFQWAELKKKPDASAA